MVQNPLLELLAIRREAVAAWAIGAAKQLTGEIESLREDGGDQDRGGVRVQVRRGSDWKLADQAKNFRAMAAARVTALTVAKQEAEERKDNQDAKRLEEEVKQVNLAVLILKDHEAFLVRAAANEDYDLAERLAVSAEQVLQRGLRSVQNPFLELLARKREAVAAGDFVAAKQLKVDIESLREADVFVGKGPLTSPRIGVVVRRGRDWHAGDVDGGEGRLGITVRDAGDHFVRVAWASGKEHSHGAGGLRGDFLGLMMV